MSLRQVFGLFVAFVCLSGQISLGQAGFDDDRVMIQGFYWESHRHGDPDPRFARFGSKRWYQIVQEQADTLREGRFDLIWLPPPSFAGKRSAGYNSKELWNLSNSYGDHALHRSMLEALLEKGVEPVADIVINHRDGRNKWTDFQNPDWGLNSITKNDESFSNPDSEANGTPESERGAEEEKTPEYASYRPRAYGYGDFRDVDHTNKQVQRDYIKFLLQLKSFGYRGWRYDMVHGLHAKRIANYNLRSKPTFSVGEYDWDKHGEQRGWVWWSASDGSVSGADHLKTSSSVFDFSTQFALKDNKGQYRNWYALDNGLGMMGDNTDGMPWKNRAVTFLENHDTGYRTDEDNNPQKHHEHDSFQNGWEVEQAYVYILTHPGVPCVYWKHYFDWGSRLQVRIRELINARKVAGVNAGSALHVQQNAKERGVYAAMIAGRHGDLFVRVGGDDAAWEPGRSGYTDFREYYVGDGWTIWVRLPGNPPKQQAPKKSAFDVPSYQKPEDINVPEDWLQ
jgi:alpha-amylase